MILSLACDTILILSQEALFCYPHHFRLLYSPQHSWGIRLFIYAPTDGEIAMVFDTLHAITLTSSSGTEILIHIGLDTVTLKGAPFTAHVAAGDQVKKGDLLMDVDLDKITGAGLNTVTPVLICNTDDYEKISLKKEGEVSLDEAVLSIS